MRIAYVLYPEAIVINKSNGIRNQAIKWAECLSGFDDVDFISPWDNIDWSQYDVIHFFGGTQWLGFVPDLRKINDNVVFSPILDSIDSMKKLRFFANLNFKGYHHPFNMYKLYLHSFKKLLVRSEYEGEYLRYCFDVGGNDILNVPISYEMPDAVIEDVHVKENFCLHVSAIYQERKNVRRLIEASKKYKFPLVLAGNPGNEDQQREINRWIDSTPWITVKGFVSNKELQLLYQEAKVFALPSINEGVGIVALNAAVAGCEVVLTEIGGPKEYFGGLANLVNPYDVDDIGQNILKAMSAQHNTNLKQYISENYSAYAVGKKLHEAYKASIR